MTSVDGLIAVLEAVAGFMTYIVSFLAVFVFVIVCLVTLAFLYRGADFVWAYTVKCSSREVEASPEAAPSAGGLRESGLKTHLPLPGVSLFRTHR